MDVFWMIGWVDMELAEKEESRLHEDLGFDSMDKFEVCMEIEKEFELTIPDEVSERVKTVGDIIDWLDKTINKKQ